MFTAIFSRVWAAIFGIIKTIKMSENKSEDLKDLSTEIKEQLETLVLAQEVMVPGEASGEASEEASGETSGEASGETSGEASGEVLKTEVGKESVTTVTERSGENKNQEFTVPDYSKPINISGSIVQISSPIVLIETTWPELKVDIDGILLDKGFYKIEYTLNKIPQYIGLGLFNTNRKFQKLLTYHRAINNPPDILFENGHFYLEIKEKGVIAITDGDGNYRPKSGFHGVIFVTVHRYKACECAHTLG